MRSFALYLLQVGALYLLQVGAAIRLSFSDRANFWLQLGGMGLNNGFVLLMWFLFFAGFRSVGGWRLADVALMIGILAFTVGTAGVFAGGYRDMAAAILRDEVDAAACCAAAIAGTREHRQCLGRRDRGCGPAGALRGAAMA
jgi:hypothetical protein